MGVVSDFDEALQFLLADAFGWNETEVIKTIKLSASNKETELKHLPQVKCLTLLLAITAAYEANL